MPYDEDLAERIRYALADRPGVTEKKMFGGICFLLRGNMVLGVTDDVLMVRVGREAHEECLTRPHARPMDFTGTPMRGYVFVDPEGTASKRSLERWVRQGEDFVATLPPKQAKKRAKKA